MSFFLRWCFLILLLGHGFVVNAQTFYKQLGQAGRNERAMVLFRSPSNDIFMGGSAGDSAMVQRLNGNGDVLWTRTFKPPGTYPKMIFHLIMASDGSLIGCGNGLSTGQEPFEAFYFKMDINGNVQWLRHWENTLVYNRRIAELSPNEYMLFCDYYDLGSATSADLFQARVDAGTGDITWTSPKLDLYSDVPYIDDVIGVATLNNSHFATGRIFTNGSPVSTCRAYVSKFDNGGNHLWTRYLLYPNNINRRMYPSDIVVDGDSLVIAYGGDINGASTNYSVGLIKTDTLGNVSWARDFNVSGSTQEISTKVIVTSFGYLLAGRSTIGNLTNFLIAVSSNGTLLWSKRYGNAGLPQVGPHSYQMNLTDIGAGFLLCGSVQVGGETDIFLARTDIDGNIDCGASSSVTALTTVLPTLNFTPNVNTIPMVVTVSPGQTALVVSNLVGTCSVFVDLGPDTTTCGAFVIHASQSGATYLWQDGSTADSLIVDSSGTYWVSVSFNCCTASDSITVQLNGNGPAPDLGPDTVICAGADLLLTIGLPGPYLWQDGSTDPDLLATGPGTYWVDVGPAGCISSDTVVISLTTVASVDLGPDTAMCDGAVIVLDPPMVPGDYLWSDSSTDVSLLVIVPGTYWLQVTDNGCSSTDTVVVSTMPLPTAALGPDTSSCNGMPLLLAPALVDADQYSWIDGSQADTLLVSLTGSYWIQAFNLCGVSVDTVFVTITGPTLLDLGPDTSFCAGSSITLSANLPGWDLYWSDSSATNGLMVDSGGLYWLDAYNGQCSVSDSLVVVQQDLPTVVLPNDSAICEGVPFTIVPITSNVELLSWSDGSDAPSLIVTEPAVYSLTVSNACGSAMDSMVVSTITLAMDLGPDTALCSTDQLLLDLSGNGYVNTWMDTVQTDSYLVAGSGTYWVEGDLGGCLARDTIVVSSIFANVDLGPDVLLCEGDSLVLTLTGNVSMVTWQDIVQDTSYVVMNEGVYWVAAMVVGCLAYDTIGVSLVPAPALFALIADTVICDQTSVVLDAGPSGVDAVWSNGTIGQTILISTSGTYWATIFNSCGQASDTTQVVFAPLNVPMVDVQLCIGRTTELIATLPYETILWNTGENTPSITVGEGVFSYVAEDEYGCIRVDSAAVNVDPSEDGVAYIPNVFTPNGDGINEEFSVAGAEQSDFEMNIYNRWGEELFTGYDPYQGWSGEYKGRTVPDGTYVYIVQYRDKCAPGEVVVKQVGHVTLLR